MTNINNKYKLSPKTKVRFNPNELDTLKKYVSDEPAAYVNITLNTGIARTTVKRLLQSGWLELKIAISMRDFIKKIPELV